MYFFPSGAYVTQQKSGWIPLQFQHPSDLLFLHYLSFERRNLIICVVRTATNPREGHWLLQYQKILFGWSPQNVIYVDQATINVLTKTLFILTPFTFVNLFNQNLFVLIFACLNFRLVKKKSIPRVLSFAQCQYEHISRVLIFARIKFPTNYKEKIRVLDKI